MGMTRGALPGRRIATQSARNRKAYRVQETIPTPHVLLVRLCSPCVRKPSASSRATCCALKLLFHCVCNDRQPGTAHVSPNALTQLPTVYCEGVWYRVLATTKTGVSH